MSPEASGGSGQSGSERPKPQFFMCAKCLQHFTTKDARDKHGCPDYIGLGVGRLALGVGVSTVPTGILPTRRKPTSSFTLQLGLTDEDLSKAKALAPDKEASTWITETIRSFCYPYLSIWLNLNQSGVSTLRDFLTAQTVSQTVSVKRDEVEPARLLTFGPAERAPSWLREVKLDSDLIVPLERAFQLTVLTDKKLNRQPHWSTINEMATKIVESRLGTAQELG